MEGSHRSVLQGAGFAAGMQQQEQNAAAAGMMRLPSAGETSLLEQAASLRRDAAIQQFLKAGGLAPAAPVGAPAAAMAPPATLPAAGNSLNQAALLAGLLGRNLLGMAGNTTSLPAQKLPWTLLQQQEIVQQRELLLAQHQLEMLRIRQAEAKWQEEEEQKRQKASTKKSTETARETVMEAKARSQKKRSSPVNNKIEDSARPEATLVVTTDDSASSSSKAQGTEEEAARTNLERKRKKKKKKKKESKMSKIREAVTQFPANLEETRTARREAEGRSIEEKRTSPQLKRNKSPPTAASASGAIDASKCPPDDDEPPKKKPKSSRTIPKECLIYEPTDKDVLSGPSRGRSLERPGNKAFRELCEKYDEFYLEAQNVAEKSAVVNYVMKEVRSSGGRFLRRHDDQDRDLNDGVCWVELTPKEQMRKVRDHLYKLSKDKNLP